MNENTPLIEMVEDDEVGKSYSSSDGVWTLRREKDTLTPNGNKMENRWVLRRQGEMIDFGPYRNDLAEHHKLKILSNPSRISRVLSMR